MKGKQHIISLAAALLCALALILQPAVLLTARAEAGSIIINQLYGGGGKGDTPFSHSFIELYNPTDADISLDTYRITYSSNRENADGKHAGSTWQSDGMVEVITLHLSGSIPAHHSYLIRCAAEETTEAVVTLDAYDMEWQQVIDNDKSVELILYNGEQRIDAISTRDTDFHNIGEGDAPAATEISKQKSLRRTNFADTNVNAADFRVLVWDSLPADETEKQQFIQTYRPRSLADGAWTESLEVPQEPETPQIPTQDWTLKTEGFENAEQIALNRIGQYVSGTSNKDGGVAEIISYDAANNKAWVVNGTTGTIDILSLADVTCGVSERITAESIPVAQVTENAVSGFAYGDTTSVAVNAKLGIAAAAMQDADYNKNGYVALFNTDGTLITMLPAGKQPDMLCFTLDGMRILVANEGEPREGIGEAVADPEGSVTVITLNTENYAASQSETIGFAAFDDTRDALVSSGIIFRKGALPSVDFEPEYIACDDSTAYIALQEANAVAVLDLQSKTYTGVYSLGYKDLSLPENAIDLTEDNAYSPKTYPDAVAAYMPDGISLYTVNGRTYLITANEGDAREWGKDATEYVNEQKTDLKAADGTDAPKIRSIDESITDGLPAGKSVLFGGRSFSVYQVTDSGLQQIFDSANDFEEKTAAYIPGFFNCSNDDNEYDSRSAKKGPEPESVTIGAVDGKTYAFVALERISGIMVYDITDPLAIKYCNYINTRNFAEDPDNANPEKNPEFYLTGDVAPEGLYFIGAESSPSGTPILLSAFEVSGTVAAYAVGETPAGHTYGPWTDCGDGKNHKRTCACGETITEAHRWDEGTVTQPATTTEKGIKTYTCTLCGATRQEEIAALALAPQTGATASISLWVALAFASLAGVIGTVVIGKKKNCTKK